MAGIDSYVKLMLHCNGADASTTFTDSSASAHTVTANGNAQIDTAQSVFGGASGLFDGDADYLSVPDHADFYYGTGDFTIDFRVRFTALPGNDSYSWFYNQRADGNNAIQLCLYNSAGTYKVNFSCVASSVLTIEVVKDVTVVVDTWYHLALVRTGNDFKVFWNGTQAGTTVTDASEVPDIAANVDIGRWTGEGFYLNGWIDEFRISKGIARWTDNFTPPTEEYNITVSVPTISCIDTFVSPSINVVTSPALSSVDTFVAPSIRIVSNVPALSSPDTFVAPGVKITATVPAIELRDNFIAPNISFRSNRVRVQTNLPSQHVSLKFQNNAANSGLNLKTFGLGSIKLPHRHKSEHIWKANHISLKFENRTGGAFQLQTIGLDILGLGEQ